MSYKDEKYKRLDLKECLTAVDLAGRSSPNSSLSSSLIFGGEPSCFSSLCLCCTILIPPTFCAGACPALSSLLSSMFGSTVEQRQIGDSVCSSLKNCQPRFHSRNGNKKKLLTEMIWLLQRRQRGFQMCCWRRASITISNIGNFLFENASTPANVVLEKPSYAPLLKILIVAICLYQ